MKILVITDTFPKLSETFVINHITALIERGHDVQILARRTPEEPKVHTNVREYELLEKTLYFDLPKNHLARLLATPKAILSSSRSISVIKELNPLRYGFGVLTLQALFRSKDLPMQHFDLIHCHYGTIAWTCLFLKDTYNAPLITSFHGCDLERVGKWGRFLYLHLFRYGDGFVANSDYTQKLLVDIGCPPEKIEKIPVIALERGVRPNRKILDSTVVTILTVARLDKAKGIQFCLYAIKNLRNQGYNLRYVIVGDGYYRRNLEKISAEIGLNDITHFTGWLDQNEVFEHYQKADIFVIASYNREETQGLVIQEAQQHGLVVVGSNICGIPEGLNWGKAGLLFGPENVEDLVAKFKSLLDTPEYARSLAQAGNTYFIKNY
ncbi:hypothetical protein LCGC14_2337320, partial [marine sediment metagenome]